MKRLYIFCYFWYTVSGSIQVISMGNISASVGDNVTFQCQLICNKSMLQVTWEKESGQFTGPMATYSRKYGGQLLGHFTERMVQFTKAEQNISAITLSSVNLKDQGCFKCIFNVFPFGATPGRVCLDVYEVSKSQPHLKVDKIIDAESSEETYEISCSATGKPPPEISWNLTESYQGKPQLYSITHSNQTVTMISNFTWTPGTLQRTNVICVVHYPALRKNIVLSQFIGGDTERFTSISNGAIIMICIAFIAVICTALYHIWKTHRYEKRVFNRCPAPLSIHTPLRDSIA